MLWAFLIFLGSGPTLSAAHTSRFLVPFLHWLFPGISDESTDFAQFIVRKCGHLTEYGILALLIFFALPATQRTERAAWSWRWASAAGLAALYACSDEFHQAFVPGRQGLFTDVMIDTTGALLALSTWAAFGAIRRWRAAR